MLTVAWQTNCELPLGPLRRPCQLFKRLGRSVAELNGFRQVLHIQNVVCPVNNPSDDPSGLSAYHVAYHVMHKQKANGGNSGNSRSWRAKRSRACLLCCYNRNGLFFRIKSYYQEANKVLSIVREKVAMYCQKKWWRYKGGKKSQARICTTSLQNGTKSCHAKSVQRCQNRNQVIIWH